MNSVIKVPKRRLKGEDGYHTFSIRVPDELYKGLDKFKDNTELSRNQVIVVLLTEALKIAQIEDDDESDIK